MNSQRENRWVGSSLIIAATLTIFIMLHHPTGYNAGILNEVVHGSMIGVIWLATFGVCYFGLILGIHRPLVLAASLCYLFSSLLNILAASINGFVVPEMVRKFGTEQSETILALCWALNQTLARISVVGVSVSMVLFGMHFVGPFSNLLSRIVAGIGVLAGMLGCGIMIMHNGQLDVHTALVIYSLQAVWLILVGVLTMTYVSPDKNKEPPLR